MTRTIPYSLAGVLEDLELERPSLVTLEQLTAILQQRSVKTPARIVASRLRDIGWFIQTEQRGVWEFAPASVAGAYSSHDPLMPLKSYLLKHPKTKCALTFQSGAWAHGLADRVPVRLEVAAGGGTIKSTKSMAVSNFAPKLFCKSKRNVPVLAVESIVVHMATKPRAVRSWQSTIEWLPDLTAELSAEKLLKELQGRNKAIYARTGYLLQGLRPDIAQKIYNTYQPKTKTWFGARGTLLRHDNHWLIADTLLPFDPKTLEATA